MDGSADIRIQTTKTFPGKSVITVTASDGTEAVYTLHFKCTGTPEDYITGFQSPSGNTLEFGLKNGSRAAAPIPTSRMSTCRNHCWTRLTSRRKAPEADQRIPLP